MRKFAVVVRTTDVSTEPPAPVPARFHGYNPIPLVKALGAEGAEHAVPAAVTGWAYSNRARWVPARRFSRGMIEWKRRGQ